MPKKENRPYVGIQYPMTEGFLLGTCLNWQLFFHYRNIDVSSIKELVKRWNPELVDGIEKDGNHRALADVYESIKELKFYKENLFK